jgi:hypothetical protein
VKRRCGVMWLLKLVEIGKQMKSWLLVERGFVTSFVSFLDLFSYLGEIIC